MAAFKIHRQLLLDAHYVGKFELCHLLLHKNAVFPWFILVPETDASDLFDLPEDQRTSAMNEAALISEFIKKTFGCVKVNFASIGNVVPQLHLHVVGRRPDDSCWPAPVWGHLHQTQEYSTTEIHRLIDLLGQYSVFKIAVR
ncbi:MAG: HIT domain-containing protein [Candidatus Binatia bacterium]